MPCQPDDETDSRNADLDAENEDIEDAEIDGESQVETDSQNPYVGEYDKLVRDDIPTVVRGDGNEPITRRVDGAERERYLAAKLPEEAREYAATVDATDVDADVDTDADVGVGSDGVSAERIDELADVHAVLDAIVDQLAAATDQSPDAVRERVAERQREKAADRGGFAEGVVLERIAPGDDE
jgi:predicted house-cleaning noncanonical NTP pyrophosphatase (MazG superfamily)